MSSAKDQRRSTSARRRAWSRSRSLALGLAACGGGGGIERRRHRKPKTWNSKGRPRATLTISNWPLYIDKKTVPDFEKETGVSVKYIEDVNANEEFFAKMQPLLRQGESGGRSIFVVTDWMANKMHELGYLQNFDKSALPNVEKNLLQACRHPPFDPNRATRCPWQSGMTGIIVHKDLAPDVKSIYDLFDPQYKGKVEFLNEAPRHGAAGDEVRRHRSRARRAKPTG